MQGATYKILCQLEISIQPVVSAILFNNHGHAISFGLKDASRESLTFDNATYVISAHYINNHIRQRSAETFKGIPVGIGLAAGSGRVEPRVSRGPELRSMVVRGNPG